MFCNQDMDKCTTKLILFIAGITAMALSGCLTSDTYQKQISIKENVWKSDHIPEFVFNVTDTLSGYEPQLLLRHNDNYPFSNIWLKIYIQRPGDTVYTDSFQTEIALSDNEGYWLGAEQGLNWTHRIIISNRRFEQFRQPGTYKVKVRQIMRDDALRGMMNVGWRLEKRKTLPSSK